MNNYEQDIIRILEEAGKNGLPVKKIAKHVYNMRNGLFNPVSYEEVYKDILAYINKNNKSKRPLLKKTGKWGYYSLSDYTEAARLQTFNFDAVAEDENNDYDSGKVISNEDLSLSLFD